MKRTALLLLVSLFLAAQLLVYVPKNATAAVSGWQKAVSFHPQSADDFGTAGFRQSVSNAKAAGANHVTLIIPYVQSTKTADDLNRTWNTPSDQALLSAIGYAHQQGMAVTLKIRGEISSGEWRAEINPANRDAWFRRYSEILNYYGRMAAQNGVEQICVGAEMYNVASSVVNPDNEQRWETMIASLRSVYNGSLTYSANHGGPGEFGEVQFWDKLNYMGIAAYFPLDPQNSNPTVESLVASWDGVHKYLVSPTVNKWQKPLLFTEVGYRSVQGAHSEPFSWWRSGPYDGELQAKLYEALFQFWNGQSYMVGVHWWDWESNPNAGGSGNLNYTPQNKPAQEVMKKWFTGVGQSTPTATPVVTTQPSSSASPSTPPVGGSLAFTVTGGISPAAPGVNQPSTVSINVKPTQNTTALVDVEIYNAADQRVLQKFFDNQALSTSGTVLQTSWTPPSVGTYQIKVGIFGNGWNGLLHWEDNVQRFNVGTTPVSPSPTASSSVSPSPTVSVTPSPTPTGTPATTYKTEFWNLPGTGASPTIPTRTPDLTRNDEKIDNYWGAAAPATGIGPDHFAVRWTRTSNFEAGTYTFTTESDDGIRVYVDNVLVIDQWNDHGVTKHTGSRSLSAGNHEVKVEFYDNGWDAVAKMSYVKSASATIAPTPTVAPTVAPTAQPSATVAPTASPTTASTTPPATRELQVTFPTDNSSFNGVQLFKGSVTGMSLSDYTMTWQVDGGGLNTMYDGGSQKEAWVDVSGWSWNGNGPYKLTFTAKDKSGNTIGQKDVNITISR